MGCGVWGVGLGGGPLLVEIGGGEVFGRVVRSVRGMRRM